MAHRRPRGERAKQFTSDVEGAFEGGKSDIEELKGEIEEWKDNLEGNNMEHLPKYEEVEEAYSALESAMDALDGIEVPECVGSESLTYTQDTRTSAQSRAGRLDNALNQLHAALGTAQAWLDENEELKVNDPEDEEEGDPDVPAVTQEQADEREEQRSAVEKFINDLESAIGEAENVSFPGMY
jgi:DNA repair exonuclease SbcCD ATPase subunit